MDEEKYPYQAGIDHILYSVIGGMIAIEIAGLSDLSWKSYAIVCGILVALGFVRGTLKALDKRRLLRAEPNDG